MFLQDIKQKAADPTFAIDDATETRLVDQVLSMFNDSNSEVKSLAASTYVVVLPCHAILSFQADAIIYPFNYYSPLDHTTR